MAVAGDLVVRRTPLALYRVDLPLRATVLPEDLYVDGWTGKQASLSVFAAAGNRRGRLDLFLSRRHRNYPGAPTVGVTARVAPIGAAGREVVRRAVVTAEGTRRVVLPTPAPPFRLVLSVDRTFLPTDLGIDDSRELGVLFSYRFTPGRA
jgi:hypothetical protein